MFYHLYLSVGNWEVGVESVGHTPVKEVVEVLQVRQVVECVDRRLEAPVDVTLLWSPSARFVSQSEGSLVKQYCVELVHRI